MSISPDLGTLLKLIRSLADMAINPSSVADACNYGDGTCSAILKLAQFKITRQTNRRSGPPLAAKNLFPTRNIIPDSDEQHHGSV